MNVTALPVLVGTVAALQREIVVVNVLPGLGHLFATPQHGTRAERWLVRLGFRWVASRPNSALVFQLETDRDKIVTPGRSGRMELAIIPGWGVDIDRFDLERNEASPPQVLLVARMLREKGVSDFVEAARRLREEGPSARFVIVGVPDDGNPSSIPVAELDRWNQDGSVEWWGWRGDIPELLSRVPARPADAPESRTAPRKRRRPACWSSPAMYRAAAPSSR
jgi:glycosyltransferase involved in cell wall biosynthesis